MTNGKDRTESQPIPMSEEQAETVVGGLDVPSVDPPPTDAPCTLAGCNCEYEDSAYCSCSGHTHQM